MKNKKKNSNYKINFEPKKKEKKNKGKVFLITFVCIFLALVIIAGLIFGISAAIKNKKAVVKYDGSIISPTILVNLFIIKLIIIFLRKLLACETCFI